MKKTKKDTRHVLLRLWAFQKERMPIWATIGMGLVTVGFIVIFAEFGLREYLSAAFILSLYLVQIRTADEHKDFEHDNIYHKDRPVQRGVVSLGELAVINKASILTQLALYASFFDARIMLLGLASQGYAFLTRKEFFVRDWIRKHFYTYYFSHYIQLVVLFYAVMEIINPIDVSRWKLAILFMLAIITAEVGRKMYPSEEDTIDDTYSAQLGHTGSAIVLSMLATLVTTGVFYLINTSNSGSIIFIIGPILTLGFIWNSAYHYAANPNKTNAKRVEAGAHIMYTTAMLSVILGV